MLGNFEPANPPMQSSPKLPNNLEKFNSMANYLSSLQSKLLNSAQLLQTQQQFQQNQTQTFSNPSNNMSNDDSEPDVEDDEEEAEENFDCCESEENNQFNSSSTNVQQDNNEDLINSTMHSNQDETFLNSRINGKNDTINNFPQEIGLKSNNQLFYEMNKSKNFCFSLFLYSTSKMLKMYL
jgi:hypothetical protein